MNMPAGDGWRQKALRIFATLCCAATGGALAALVGVPLPWLLGAQISLALVSLLKLPFLHGIPTWPTSIRDSTYPVLGVLIGSSFSGVAFGQILEWVPSLILLPVYLVVVHALVFMVFLRRGGYDIPTAFYAAFPGGFVEATLLGAEAGGKQHIILIQHFLRVSAIVLAVPLVFQLWSGHAVGSAAGVTLGDPTDPTNVFELLILAACAIGGTYLGRLLRLPAKNITGAMALSAIVHITGLVDGALPSFVTIIAQLAIGAALGSGFLNIRKHELPGAIRLAVGAFAIYALVAILMIVPLSHFTDVPASALYLAFSPGGVTEMSLVAVSLGVSVPIVVAHHFYRMGFTLIVIPLLYRVYGKVMRISEN